LRYPYIYTINTENFFSYFGRRKSNIADNNDDYSPVKDQEGPMQFRKCIGFFPQTVLRSHDRSFYMRRVKSEATCTSEWDELKRGIQAQDHKNTSPMDTGNKKTLRFFIKETTHKVAENSSTAHDRFRHSWGSSGCRKLGECTHLMSPKKGEIGRGLSKGFQQPCEERIFSIYPLVVDQVAVDLFAELGIWLANVSSPYEERIISAQLMMRSSYSGETFASQMPSSANRSTVT
ncbi:hypothetical protein T265_14442, partial [Opisthorchis viverrini]